MKIQFDRVYAGVNLDYVGENIDSIASNLKPDTGIIAVIKTDAYGHGALPIAKELEHKAMVLLRQRRLCNLRIMVSVSR